MDKIKKARQTAGEEIWNSLTHGAGLIISSGGAGAMIALAALTGDAWKIVSASIFGFCMILLYTASTVYHTARRPAVKNALNLFDHIAIYFLIAGTYTPYLLINLRGPLGWQIFGVIWGITILGTLFQLFFINRYKALSVLSYLVMGWVVLVAIKPLVAAISFQGLLFMMIGSACYTLGVIFYVLQNKKKFFHSLWHLFVLSGSIMFYFSILFGSILQI
jgi:hemolysin III